MTIEEEKALKYFYNNCKRCLLDPNIKGLQRKSLFSFVKQIKDLSNRVDKLPDLEEVLKYED